MGHTFALNQERLYAPKKGHFIVGYGFRDNVDVESLHKGNMRLSKHYSRNILNQENERRE
jgi:hypothetical protein